MLGVSRVAFFMQNPNPTVQKGHERAPHTTFIFAELLGLKCINLTGGEAERSAIDV